MTASGLLQTKKSLGGECGGLRYVPCRDIGHLILSAGWLRGLGIVLLCLCVHEARDMR